MIEIRFADTPAPFYAFTVKQIGGELFARGYRLERVWDHWTSEDGFEMSAYVDQPGPVIEEAWPIHRIASRWKVGTVSAIEEARAA